MPGLAFRQIYYASKKMMSTVRSILKEEGPVQFFRLVISKRLQLSREWETLVSRKTAINFPKWINDIVKAFQCFLSGKARKVNLKQQLATVVAT